MIKRIFAELKIARLKIRKKNKTGSTLKKRLNTKESFIKDESFVMIENGVHSKFCYSIYQNRKL